MINELTLLKIFCKQKIYREYNSYVQNKLLEYHIKVILQDFEEYFNIFNKDIEDFSEFYTWFSQTRHPNIPEATSIIYKEIINKLSIIEVGIGPEIIKEFQKRHLITTLEAHFKIGFNIDFVQESLDSYKKDVASLSQVDEDADVIEYCLNDLLNNINKNEGLRWRLNMLNDGIGAIKKGYLIIVGAFVDVGKTSFAVSEATYMAQQLTEGCVLWLNNEEEDYRVLRKIWKSVLNCTDAELLANPDKATEVFNRKMHGDPKRIRLVNIRKKSLKGVSRLFEKYKPALVVIDQADKISNTSFKAFSEPGQLKNIYGELRTLANTYCPVIAISQADATAMYKARDSEEYSYTLYPHHRQLDGSKIGKPGEADAIIMIGRRAENNTTRGVHISKNKFGDSNYKQEVIYNGEKCRYSNP
jgi:hypothetical protein